MTILNKYLDRARLRQKYQDADQPFSDYVVIEGLLDKTVASATFEKVRDAAFTPHSFSVTDSESTGEAVTCFPYAPQPGDERQYVSYHNILECYDQVRFLADLLSQNARNFFPLLLVLSCPIIRKTRSRS